MNCNQINCVLRQIGLNARVISAPGYYYWGNENRDIVIGSESVYVHRADQLPLEKWIDLAQDVEAIIQKENEEKFCPGGAL